MSPERGEQLPPAGGKTGPVETPSGDSLHYSRNLGRGGVGETGTSQSSWGETDRDPFSESLDCATSQLPKSPKAAVTWET